MLRTALTPKWLGALVLVFAVIVGFVLLGRWQLAVAQDKGLAEATTAAAAQPTEPLTQVLKPDGTFPVGALARRVTLSGDYVTAHQVLVPERRLGERTGYWVVTPLRVDGTGGGGTGPAAGLAGAATIPVLRGFVTDPAGAPAPTSGHVELTGTLAQSEPPPNSTKALPDGQIPSINVADLINRWGGPMYNAFVFLGDQRPAAAPSALQAVPPPPPGQSSLNWRNLAYAVQWWFFAAFALYMWWRMVRDDARERGLLRGTSLVAATDPIPAGPTATPERTHHG